MDVLRVYRSPSLTSDPHCLSLSRSLALICLVCFLMALIFTMGSGNYWLEIFNTYVGSVPFLVIALFELIGIVFFYGTERYIQCGF